MNYIKFTQIDAETGISWAIKQPVSGPSWPSIPGLELSSAIQLEQNPIYYLGTTEEEVQNNPENYLFVLTFEEYANELKTHTLIKFNREKDSIYNEENAFRNAFFDKYHDTASIAGIYKYEQAKELLVDENALAPDVRLEAQVRNIGVIELANRIIENHEDFREKEAKIAGIRGRILDRLNSFEFDLQNPKESLEEFESFEVIGTITTQGTNESGETIDISTNVEVPKYSLSLSTRYMYE